MTTLLTKLAGLGLAATVLLASCEKDEDKVTLNMSAAPQLTASATTANITAATVNQPAVTYTWTPANFGYQAAVTYTLQFANKGTDFAKVQEFNLGNALTKSFTVGELNSLYNALDCNIGTPRATPLDVRVKASVGDMSAPAYSSLTGIQAAPFQAQSAPADRWAVIGAATPGGWDNDTFMSYDFCSQTYKVTLPLTVNEFKFRANGGWATNLGGPTTGLVADGPNIAVTQAGNYEVVLNMQTKPRPTYTITKK